MNVIMNPHSNFDDKPAEEVGESAREGATIDYATAEDKAAAREAYRANLKGKHARIRGLLLDRWTTVGEISRVLAMGTTNVSGRIRELRTEACGSYVVHVRKSESGAYEYRINSGE